MINIQLLSAEYKVLNRSIEHFRGDGVVTVAWVLINKMIVGKISMYCVLGTPLDSYKGQEEGSRSGHKEGE